MTKYHKTSIQYDVPIVSAYVVHQHKNKSDIEKLIKSYKLTPAEINGVKKIIKLGFFK
jgi:hypothetical protein